MIASVPNISDPDGSDRSHAPSGATATPAVAPHRGAPLFWLPTDFRAKAQWLYGAAGAKEVLKACVTDGSLAMVFYRCMQQATRLRLGPIAMIFSKLNILLGSCVIGRGADFGPGFVLVHSLGVVINSRVQGGSHVYIEHQVTIGAERNKSPNVGSHVFIGAGAKIIGDLTVGDYVKVGANAVVLKEVPPHTTVAGVPAKVVREHHKEGSES